MLDNMLRPLKERALIPLCRFLGRRISPNGMTALSFILGLVSVLFILRERLDVALLFWGFNRITDGLDGTIARVTKRQSDLGAYLDIMADFFIYALIPLAFAYRGEEKLLYSCLIMVAVFYINGASWMYLSSLLEKRALGAEAFGEMTSVTMPSGLVEGAETIVIYTLFYILPHKLPLLFMIMTAGVLIGTFQRILWAFRNLKPQG